MYVLHLLSITDFIINSVILFTNRALYCKDDLV